MRLLNRLHQYQRLWQPSAGEPQQVTVGELAERCFAANATFEPCYVRRKSPLAAGRPAPVAKRRLLQFYKAPEALRNEMMEQALNKGQQQMPRTGPAGAGGA